ncbi:MAG: ComEC/Rec2 family competence protein, partial [Gammaproteobacteria bacterium]
MYLWAITFFLGTLFLSTRASLLSQPLAWLILLAAGILALLACQQNWRLLRLPAAFALGFAWAMCYSAWQLSWELPTELEGKDVVIEGVIASIPSYQFPRARFEFAVKSFNGQKLATKFSLSWYQKPPPLKVGERWRLQVRVKRPHAFANPGSFDYEAWLFQQGIRANGYVRESSQNELLGRSRLSYPVDQIRQTIGERLWAILGDAPSLAIVQALTIGERQAMSADQWQVLRATGTNHLMAISGLHISLMAGSAYYLVNFLWRRFARLCLWCPAQHAAAIAAIIAALFYAALAGFSVPTQRALTMIMVFMLALLWRRNLLPWQGLSLALVAVLILDPLASLSPGFYLSFAAVAIIFYGVGG